MSQSGRSETQKAFCTMGTDLLSVVKRQEVGVDHPPIYRRGSRKSRDVYLFTSVPSGML